MPATAPIAAESTADASASNQPARCPLCGGSSRQTLSTRDRHGAPLDTAICTNCGLVSHRVIPTEAELIDYYASQYRLDYHNESTPSPRRVMRAWRQGRGLLGLLSPFIKPGSSVVEIGAGIGCTVKAFELAGHDARGYEPGGGFQSYSQNKLGAKVERISLAQVPTSPTADLALLVHVIEHLRDPLAALNKLRELIGDDGVLYVECPNLSAPFARPGKRFHRAHIFNFTGATLEAFAHRAGLETVRRFGSERHPNLAFLFRSGEQADAIDASNYTQTMRALNRYNALTYHLRPWYLSARAIKVSQYLFEHISAPIAVRRFEQRCIKYKQIEKKNPCHTK